MAVFCALCGRVIFFASVNEMAVEIHASDTQTRLYSNPH
jgi:hypothetical protein